MRANGWCTLAGNRHRKSMCSFTDVTVNPWIRGLAFGYWPDMHAAKKADQPFDWNHVVTSIVR